jgi:hypothetical protein
MQKHNTLLAKNLTIAGIAGWHSTTEDVPLILTNFYVPIKIHLIPGIREGRRGDVVVGNFPNSN